MQITGVRLNATAAGLEIVLETVAGLSIPETYVVDNALIADIPNAVFIPPSGFQQENPAEGIASVSVTNLPNNFVRVAITGLDAPPIAEVRTEAQGLVLSVVVEEPEDEAIEIVVTGEQDTGYYVPNASTATRTDTPLRDIPQSIQVVPNEVLQDRGIVELRDALENVAGVQQQGTRGTGQGGDTFTVRGSGFFTETFRDGIRYNLISPTETSDIERIEVLKGPASVLFGRGEPGGIINLIPKQPLDTPYYAASFTAGSFSTYQGQLDISGPLNTSRTLKYRLNVFYENYGSFRDFVNGERLAISPSVILGY